MFKSLKIVNFQPHRCFEVDLDPLATSFIGESDTGKSSLIRAIKWICLNMPGGDEFIRDGAEFVRGVLRVGKQTVTRRKGKKGNVYKLDGKPFKAVRNSVPEQIQSLLNVDETNFQGQHDAPFWFSRTPGQVSKELNQIINLDVIDVSLGNVAAQLRETRAELTVTQNRLRESKEQKEQLSYVPLLNKDLKALEEQDRERYALRCKIMDLEAILKRINDLEERCASNRQVVLSMKKRFQDLTAARDEYEAAASKVRQLKTILAGIIDLEEEACLSKKALDAGQAKLQGMTKGRCPVCGKKMS